MGYSEKPASITVLTPVIELFIARNLICSATSCNLVSTVLLFSPKIERVWTYFRLGQALENILVLNCLDFLWRECLSPVLSVAQIVSFEIDYDQFSTTHRHENSWSHAIHANLRACNNC